jgi:hypothetical protein
MTSDSSITRDGVYVDNVYCVQAQPVAFDSMESASGWAGLGGFAWVTDRSFSPIHSWTDSPGTTYTNNFSTTLTQNGDKTGGGDLYLVFRAYLDSEANYDFLSVRTSSDGLAFEEKGRFSGRGDSWQAYSVPIGSPARYRIQFAFTTDVSVTYDGVWVDDVAVVSEPWVKVDGLP